MLKSKKFYAAIIAAVFGGIGAYFPDHADAFHNAANAFIAYVVGQGIADVGKEAKKIKE